MDIVELEELLAEALPTGFHFQIDTDNSGQIILLTGLREDDEGELVALDEPSVEGDLSDEGFERLKDYEDDL
jgi:hypothetical protein